MGQFPTFGGGKWPNEKSESIYQEYKVEVAMLVIDQGMKVADVAKDHGVSFPSLSTGQAVPR